MALLRLLLVLTAFLVATSEAGNPYTGQADTKTRLVGGRKASEGRLEVLVNGTWGTVCDAKLSWRDAITVCRELGFPLALGVQKGGYFGQGTGKILMSNLQCTGSEESVHDCPHKNEGEFECDHERDSGVFCMPMTPMIRLADSPYEGAGRVELSFDNGTTWGTICNKKWSWRDWKVACRQLGYSGSGIQDLPDVVPGSEDQPIYVSRLLCSRECSSEANLLQCPHQWENIECGHEQDVGVICGGQIVPPEETTDEPIYAASVDEEEMAVDLQ